MQIEKHVNITKTPTGALVYFAGQVCLTVVQQGSLDSYFWRASPMFLKLATGANAFDVPQSYISHSSLAEAIADGLTKLDDLGAFYGVTDIPEDTYVEEHLDESNVVRTIAASYAKPARTFISAALALSKAREIAQSLAKDKDPKDKEYYNKGRLIVGPKHLAAARDAILAQHNEAIEAIRQDCRAESMLHEDDIVAAHYLATGLFEDIVEEYLNEIKSDVVTTYDKEKTTNTAKTESGKKSLYKQVAQSQKEPKTDKWKVKESVDEAAKPLAGDAYWKAKEQEAKDEFLKAQRKTLGLPEPVKRGRGKPTNIDRDILKTRAHENIAAGKRPTDGFDRNEKIHFVRHLKNHPDFADHHVSKAGRPVGTTKSASQEKEVVKKKQDTAFSMWAGLGKK